MNRMTLPDTMKAIVISKPGDASVLTIASRAVPAPGDREVLINVRAAGINRPDVAQRKGHYPAPEGVVQDIPGLEVAGIVAAVGGKVTRWKPGDAVCALVAGGGYAEYCPAPEGQCLPVPESLSLVEAASLPETFFTVWHNVFQRGNLQQGETLLVHGGSGGIGTTAIQLGAAFGATVFTTAGTTEKCAYCEQMGATKAINYNTDDFVEAVKNSTAAKGVDVILDMVGGDYTPRNLSALAVEGRLVLINFMRGNEVTIRLSDVMRKRLTVTGSTMRARDETFKSSLAGELETHVWPKISSGTIKTHICKIFPPDQAAAAHEMMEQSRHMGKIVIEMKFDNLANTHNRSF